jgi:RNA polymerase sigma factor (sigma-70 family)
VHIVWTRVTTEVSDASLVVAIGRWDRDAFAEVYRRHGGAAYSLACRTLSDRHTAEEVVQEVFLRLWERPERFEAERGTLRTYLLLETHGRCIDVVRSRTRRAQREERVVQLNPTDPYDLELEIWDLTLAERVREARAALKSPAGIATAATIEPVELQHAAILNFILGNYPVPDSFTPTAVARSTSDQVG